MENTNRNDFKAHVKNKVREYAFRELQDIKTKHSKVKKYNP